MKIQNLRCVYLKVAFTLLRNWNFGCAKKASKKVLSSHTTVNSLEFHLYCWSCFTRLMVSFCSLICYTWNVFRMSRRYFNYVSFTIHQPASVIYLHCRKKNKKNWDVNLIQLRLSRVGLLITAVCFSVIINIASSCQQSRKTPSYYPPRQCGRCGHNEDMREERIQFLSTKTFSQYYRFPQAQFPE